MKRILFATLVVGTCLVPGPSRAVVSATVAGQFVPVAVTNVGGPLALVNLDTLPHNFMATTTRPDGSASFCAEFLPGSCPLFWSPLVDRGGVGEVQGLSGAQAGRAYGFTCEIHLAMTGTLYVL